MYCIFHVVHVCSSTSDLRLDSLSQILTLSNARAGCRMIVVESCQGMVAGALLERMGGKYFKSTVIIMLQRGMFSTVRVFTFLTFLK